MLFLVFLLVPLNTWQHQCTDKYTQNTSLYKIRIFENSRCYPFHSKCSRYYIRLQFLLFRFYLKRVILDKVNLDFYIYQLFNIHTERLLDTVVPLNLFNVKRHQFDPLVLVNQCLLHFSIIINVIFSNSTKAIKQMATSTYR